MTKIIILEIDGISIVDEDFLCKNEEILVENIIKVIQRVRENKRIFIEL